MARCPQYQDREIFQETRLNQVGALKGQKSHGE